MHSKRPATRIDTVLSVTSPYSDFPPDCRITNLSASGAFIHTIEPLPVDTMVALIFRLPGDNAAITIDARVIWWRSTCSLGASGMGVQFTSISLNTENKLADFIQRNIRGLAQTSKTP